MKKLTSLLLVISYLLFVNAPVAFAQTPTSEETTTPTPTKKPSEADAQINSLKDRIASKVAELNLVDKKGIIGTVNSIADTQITITNLANETNFIDVDEITQFASPSAKESFGISDLTRGTKIAILGLYNKQSRRTLARFIEIALLPKTISGAIVAIDPQEFTVDVLSDDGNIYTFDIETSTRTFSYTKDAGMVKLGFSKLEKDQRVIARGFPTKNDPKRITASRILVFAELPKNPKLADISLPSEKTSTPSASPTGKSKK